MSPMPDDHERAKEQAKIAIQRLFGDLAEVSVSDMQEGYQWADLNKELERFKIASLFRVMLFHVCDFEGYGPGEKFLWGVLLRAEGHLISLSHRKFGLRGSIGALGTVPDTQTIRRLVGKLMQSIQTTEKYLEVFGASQLREGNVTVPNRFGRLSSRYEFFRTHAKTSFESPPPPPKHLEFDSDGHPTSTEFYWFKPEIEGGYFAIAMMDAYFSRLEHLLVLFLPFLNRPSPPLLDFIGSTWDAKLLQVMDIAVPANKKLYDALKALKERQRNVFAHGDFEKQGASLYFHVPEMCAVPVALSAHSRSAVFGFHDVHIDSFQEICEIFDKVDDCLKNTSCYYGWAFAESGLDVSFGKKSRADYAAAMADQNTFNAYLDRMSYYADQAANMDF